MKDDLIKRIAGLPAEKRSLLLRQLRDAGIAIAEPSGEEIATIARADRSGELPLSWAQERLWFLEQLVPGNPFYNIPISLHITGRLDIAALERSFAEIVKRHETLRTRISSRDGAPFQVIDEAAAVKMAVLDISGLGSEAQPSELEKLTRTEALKAFRISEDIPIRVTLVRCGDTDFHLLITMHHIASDAWSTAVLVRELTALYQAFSADPSRDGPLPPLAVQYADFAQWQRKWLTGDLLEKQLSYWKKSLEGAPPLLSLPCDRPRPAVQSYRAGSAGCEIDRELLDRLKELGSSRGATLFMTLFSAFSLLMHRYSGQNDIVTGSPVANRTKSEIEGLIGFFVNTLPLRSVINGDLTVSRFIEETRDRCIEAFTHQDVPFEKLVEELKPERHINRQPLAQVLFTLQNAPDPETPVEGLSISRTETDTTTARYDLEAYIWETSSGLHCLFVYSSDLFEAATIERMLGHYINILKGFVESPSGMLSELCLLGSAERHRILEEWNDTAADYRSETTVDRLFEEQAARTPDSTAMIAGDEHITYRELDRRVNRMADYISRVAGGRTGIIGICMKRCPDTIISMLAILRSGSAYVPLDPENPDGRLAVVIHESGALMIVAEEEQRERVGILAGEGRQVISPDKVWLETAGLPERTVTGRHRPDDLAYLIFTSGSTGVPKGVMISHGGLVNIMEWQQRECLLTSDDRMLFHTTFTFDISATEIYWPLMTGMAIVISKPGGSRDIAYLCSLIREAMISVMNIVPSLLSLLVEEGPHRDIGAGTSLRFLLSGGEALDTALARRCLSLFPAELINMYGPTEDTIISSSYHCDRSAMPDTLGGKAYIGKPVSNAQFYVLDEMMNPLPPGIAGELYIGGVGLAVGYIGSAGLTAEKFVPDPFSGLSGSRLYRTGDLVRLLADGNVEFLGRLDHQVKLRGFRIETGEIEAALSQHPLVQEAVVALRSDDGALPFLAAYIRPRGNGISEAALRDFLGSRLPDYMIPAAFVLMESFSHTSSGKVDRKALPAPLRRKGDGPAASPSTPTEEMVAAIWKEVLKTGELGADDNFFAIGGHSLSATQVISRVNRLFSVELPLKTIFESPTVRQMGVSVDESLHASQGDTIPALKSAERGGEIPLSWAQERLWFLGELVPDNAFYIIPGALRIKGGLDVEALLKSFGEIVRRHEALRTTFLSIDGRPVQVIEDGRTIELPVIDLSGLDERQREQEMRRLARTEALTSFDLSREIPVRIKLIELSRHDRVLLISMHHIASDGWSLGVLIDELTTLYEAFSGRKPSPLPDLPVQYADFAMWQRGWLTGEALGRQLDYWKGQLEGAPDLLSLPYDRPRPAVQSFAAGIHTSLIEPGLAVRLKELSDRKGCTLFMTVLSAFAVLMQRYSGQSDIVIGSPVANRTQKEIEKLIGFFVNTLALRLDLQKDPSFEELMEQARRICIEAYMHQDIPFEKLVDELNPERHMDRQPLVQVVLALQNMPMPEMALSDCSISHFEVDAATVRFDLEVHLWESEEGLHCSFMYSSALFDRSTVESMMSHFITLLEGAAGCPEKRVSELSVISKDERYRALVEWNDTEMPYRDDLCAHQLFEEQAKLRPDSTAVVFSDCHVTYGELNSRADRTACLLAGSEPESLIGIYMERSPELIEAVLAILKAGCAYVPLDPEYPESRVAFMIEDSALSAVITLDRHVEPLKATLKSVPAEIRIIPIGNPVPGCAPERAVSSAFPISPDNLAYVIYTSGSTGKPKGSLIPHRGICSLAAHVVRQCSVTDESSFLQFFTLNFDASVLEIFSALLCGATLVMARKDDLLPGPSLVEIFNRHLITHTLVPPAVPAALSPDDLPELRCLISGGDVCPAGLLQKWLRPGRRVFNAYGPTEVTVAATIFEWRGGDEREAPPIGFPLDNVKTYILDENMEPVPPRVPGELYIGGIGIARGYLNLPGLTAERFIPSPWKGSGARLYRTGDRARYRRDGAIEFLGRLDSQVKIRGFRIEPGEIESLLCSHYAVSDAIVTAAKTERHDAELVAYAIPDRSSAALRDDLAIWQKERVEHWKSIYDDTLGSSDPDDLTFNITGWNSSYTGEPIPEEEMREWVDETVARILSQKPERVLEIGCGTGLLLSRVAPSCEEYVGTDFSASSLHNVVRMKESLTGLERVTTLLRTADDFSGLEPQSFDMVILNSIIQYFPGMDYLMKVLKGALAVLKPGGSIFLGDLRNLSLLELYHTSVALYRAGGATQAGELRKRIAQAVRSEEELLLSPSFFNALTIHYGDISHVKVMPKKGRAVNELTKFRYDALIFTGPDGKGEEVEWLAWGGDPDPEGRLEELLRDGAGDLAGLSGVPDARLQADLRALELLSDHGGSSPMTVSEIRERSSGSADFSAIDNLREIGDRYGYDMDIALAGASTDGSLDIVFRSRRAAGGIIPMMPMRGSFSSRWSDYGNDPLAPVLRGRLVPLLRSWLRERLPDYMVPSAFVILDSFPATPSGKADRKALPAPERGADERRHAPPSTAAEAILAEIWREVLGLEKVGVSDNFFELGGDSIISIQVISRANRRGLALTARMIFEHQTIAELAAACWSGPATDAEQGIVSGTLPLTPIQHWFFQTHTGDVNHFNQAVMLEAPEDTDAGLLEKAAGLIVAHHDSLRLRYSRDGQAWHQAVAPSEENNIFSSVDLSEAEDLQSLMKAECERIQAGLDIYRGPLVRMAFFRMGKGKSCRLMIAAHHLAVDGVSWRILIPDLSSAYEQLSTKGSASLPPKTTSFKGWAHRLGEYAASRELAREKTWWRKALSEPVPPLPCDLNAGLEANTVESSESVIVSLDEAETSALLRDVPPVYRTQINDALLAALGQALVTWTGNTLFRINLEGHGREELFSGVDLSRTVGWFTSLFPVTLDMTGLSDPGSALRTAKETLKAIPGRGTGFGILRYMSPDNAIRESLATGQAEISFNYLGQVDTLAGEGIFRLSGDPAGAQISPSMKRPHLVEINSLVSEGRLTIDVQYSANLHSRETIGKFALAFRDALLGIIGHCRLPESGGFTPSDFPLARLSQEALDRLTAAKDVEDIYPLSPMQQGMLFHTLYEPESGVYSEIMSFRITGGLSSQAFRRAWQAVVDRHAIMRTSFAWESLEKPLQIVWRSAVLDWTDEDWRDMDRNEREAALGTAVTDPGVTIDLGAAPAMKCRLIRTGEHCWYFIWSFHHIILDGWCLPLIMEEVLLMHEAAVDGRQISLSQPLRYRDYIEWLSRRDMEEAAGFWRRELKGFSAPTPLGITRCSAAGKGYREKVVSMSQDLTARLSSFARREHVTMFTAIQGAWALLLSRYSGESDVLFGAVTSGRPGEIEQVDRILGLFINAIPVRVDVSGRQRTGEWLRSIHARHIEREQYSYPSLVQISGWSEITGGEPLFQSIIGLENYPVEDSLMKNDWRLNIDEFTMVERTNYAINMAAMPGPSLKLRFLYDSERFDDGSIDRIAGHLQTIFEGMVSSPDAELDDLEILTPAERNRLLAGWNDDVSEFGADRNIHQLFEEVAEREPDRTAVQYEEQAVTYRELNESANRLACLLREKGCRPDSLVGLIMDRSIEAVTAILAVLKAGAAYVPMDPELPEERVLSILDDSGASLLLSKDPLMSRFASTSLKRIKAGTAPSTVTAPRCQIVDFDSLPHPDRKMIQYEKYHRYIGLAPVRHSISLQGTRGCPYNCAYCHKIWPKRHVVRDAENIFAEMMRCYDAGIRRFTFVDDIFNLDRKNSTRLFEMLVKNRLDVQLFFPNGMRGDILTKDVIDLMVEAGAVHLAMALETASPRMQKLVRKNLDLDRLKENLDYVAARYPGLLLELFMMIGFPSETEEEALMTFDFLKQIKWIHFPYLHILKIYPNTDMHLLALEHGVDEETIERSLNLTYHELPETLPFPKSFARKYQVRFMNEYFLSRERLLHVLPYQMKVLTEDELVQKYDSYLPTKIKSFDDLLKVTGIAPEELGGAALKLDDDKAAPDFTARIESPYTGAAKKDDAMRILLLDLSQLFTDEKGERLYDLVEAPLGLLYVMTYIEDKFRERVAGKIAKSRIDFNSYHELRDMLEQFRPDLIGIRTLSCYKEFFHRTVSLIRQWGFDAPLVSGGPYATSDHILLSQEPDIDLIVLGEGEMTFSELVERMLDNGGKLPADDVLETIAGLVFVRKEQKELLRRNTRTLISVDLLEDRLARYPSENLAPSALPGNLAYVIYTSGSTGRPKGVLIPHSNVTRLFRATEDLFELSSDDRWSCFHSFAFDFSVWEIWGALLSGASLDIVPSCVTRDTERFHRLLEEDGVTVLSQTPSAFMSLMEVDGRRHGANLSLRYIVFGGERLDVQRLAPWWERHGLRISLVNMYGITETTVHSTFHELSPVEMAETYITSPIGARLPDMTFYVLDPALRPMPVGVPGELHIGGERLARCYLGDAVKTASRFIPDLFGRGGRLYKTGDLVRRLPDGSIDYLGRVDNQVKIRGYRIELGEIEAVLSGHPSVKKAVVVLREDLPGHPYMAAYIQPESPVLTSHTLQAFVKDRLPEYMLPSSFTMVRAFPLTSGGKVDRRMLPAPERGSQGENYEPPSTPTEEIVAGIWKEVLGVERTGVYDNFLEIGGHSLNATQVVSRVCRAFPIDLPLRTVFDYPTLRDLSARIDTVMHSAQLDVIPPIEPERRDASTPLSWAQERLWFLDQLVPGNPFYNIPMAFRIEGNLDIHILRRVFEEITMRHESLRTSFISRSGEPRQVVRESAGLVLDTVDLSRLDAEKQESELKRLSRQEALRTFDLSHDALIRVTLLRCGDKEHVLLLTMHHIVSDGWSMGVLMKEIVALYEAFLDDHPSPLEPLPVQYADFALWQRKWLSGPVLDMQMAYWKSRLADAPSLLPLPCDRPRPPVQSFRGGKASLTIDPELAWRLRALSERSGTTLFMTLLSGFAILMNRYSGEDDILIGSPVANRNRREIEGLIGFFVNTLVLRHDFSADRTFGELLLETRKSCIEAYTHQDIPFEKIVDELAPARSMDRQPLVQVVFALQNAPMPDTRHSGLSVSPLADDGATVRFDLEAYLWEGRSGIDCTFMYSADLFDAETIERMLVNYRTILERAVESPGTRLSEISLMSPDERHMLAGWNRTGTAYPCGETLRGLFAEQVRMAPDAVAASFDDQYVTYGELDSMASALAGRLIALGVKPEVTVGICAERSISMLAAVSAVVRSGGVFVPLDPDYPRERLAYIIGDSDIKVLLMAKASLPVLQGLGEGIEVIAEDDWFEQPGNDAASPSGPSIGGSAVHPDNLAYIMYTSGSTGEPKGVCVTNRNIVRLVRDQNYISIRPGDVIAHASNVSFDASTFEIWGALLNGACIEIIPRDTLLAPFRLSALIKEKCVTAQFFTTALFNTLVDTEIEILLRLKTILFGGELVNASKVHQLMSRRESPEGLLHVYGPTETVTFTTFCHLGSEYAERSILPIGEPLSNTAAFVLDRNLEPVPVGVPGELYIGGDGLSRCYLNSPELTAAKFVPDAHSGADGARLYRTGDTVRRLADGKLEFLSRVDHQVKIRGFRIEPGEVEAVLSKHEAVADSVVLARKRGDRDAELIAYAVPDRNSGEIRDLLREWHRERVSHWQRLFEETMADPGLPGDDITFKITGWQSSYTGGQIPAEDMRQWVDNTVARITSRRPARVLEIGCGTGLLLSRIAPQCEAYVGTDFSPVSLAHIEKIKASTAGLSHVRLFRRNADDFSGFDRHSFDTVILNSIVQYFPGIDYLMAVVEGAMEMVKPGGWIFMGDLRNLSLLEAYHTSVTLYRSPSALAVSDLLRRVRSEIANEDELLISPLFFTALKEKLGRVSFVEVLPKEGSYLNELSKFRYDAFVHLDGNEREKRIRWMDWRSDRLSPDLVKSSLEKETGDFLGIRQVPNSRVLHDAAAVEIMMSSPAPLDAGELSALASEREGGLDPAGISGLCSGTDWSAQISWESGYKDGSFDVVFHRASAGPEAVPVIPAQGRLPGRWSEYVNDPLALVVRSRMAPILREYLRERLPAYMMPSAIVIMDSFPLSGTGKVNRRALPVPERIADAGRFTPPSTPAEEMLADIWKEVLGLERVGRGDNFFEMGGHSLYATQVISRVCRAFSLDIPLRTIFESPALEDLAGAIEGMLKASEGAAAPQIEAGSRTGDLPLSFAQERLWFLDQLMPGNPFYNMPAAIRLQGPVDLDALKRAFAEIVRRHEPLRTRLVSRDGAPVQIIDPFTGLDVPLTDLSHLSPGGQAVQIGKMARDEALKPFDLSKDLLLRLTLVKAAREDHILLATMHHIVSDGWSMGILIRETVALYDAFLKGEPSPLPPLSVHYADFAIWQRRWLSGAVLEEQMSYWKKRLKDSPALLELPYDRPRPPVQSFRGEMTTCAIDASLKERLRELCAANQTSLFMSLLAAFTVLMHRYSGDSDIVVGSPVANRNRREIESIIGFFVNTLALRSDLSDDPTFTELLERMRKTCIEAYAHQDLPFEKIVDELNPERHMDRQPIVQVIFVLQNAPMPELSLSGLAVTPLDADAVTVRFDLEVNAWEQPEGIHFNVFYSSDLFDRKTIDDMMSSFTVLLEAAAARPGMRISELPVLSSVQRNMIVNGWNAGESAPHRRACLHRLFEERAMEGPDSIALTCGDHHVSYGELNRRANIQAHELMRLGVGPEKPVGLCAERSVEMVTGLIAILKAGGAYLPLDPSYPAERLGFMADDAKLEVIVMQKSASHLFRDRDIRTVTMDESPMARQDPGNPESGAIPENLAYIIYTSGSTGRPKGTLITHDNVTRLFAETDRLFSFDGADIWSCFHSYAFDFSVWEIWGALLHGARCVIAPFLTTRDPAHFWGLLEEEQVTVLSQIPSAFTSLISQAAKRRNRSLRYVVFGGESLDVSRLRAWWDLHDQHSPQLVNMYGITEITVHATFHALSPADLKNGQVHSPIGRRLDDMTFYVLDGNLDPVPAGVPGELYIGGAGTARGYLFRPELTAERFIPDPFTGGSGERLYRTGDRVRWLPDGTVDFLGRADEQVKIRGFRIEPGEVESVLAAHGDVDDAVVIPYLSPGGDRQLVAYAVPARDIGGLGEMVERWRREQVSHWQSLYDQTMAAPSASEDITFNITGWNSSYTGKPIPEEEMREWVDATVSRILSLKPRRVLEIGCGTGLLLSRIAPSCEEYTGTDFSAVSLQHIEKIRASVPGLENVRLLCRNADELDDLDAGHYDLVIMNSVIQYFPSVEYLLAVLEKAFRLVKAGGHVFTGDIRNYRLLREYHASVKLFNASPSASAEELSEAVRQGMWQEEELLVDPSFFTAIKERNGLVNGARALLKAGRYQNELTGFRYDAVIDIGERAEEKQIPSVEWQSGSLSLQMLGGLLGAEKPEKLLVSSIPNRRVIGDALAAKILSDRGSALTAEEIREKAAAMQQSAVRPDDLLSLGAEKGYIVELRWDMSHPEGAFDAVFRLAPSRAAEIAGADAVSAMQRESGQAEQAASTGSISGSATDIASEPVWPSSYTNDPLKSRISSWLSAKLRDYLQQRVPDYMMPSFMIIIDALPRTPSGKVDRRALPEPVRPPEKEGYVAPRNEREKELERIWREILEIRTAIGVRTSFFSLGGHSLLAVRLMAAIEKGFGISLPLSRLFESPTIEKLAECLQRAGEEDGPWSPLVTIQASGDRRPFFCVPGGGGTVMYLHELAVNLGEDRPFYAFESAGLDGRSEPFTTIEEMAACFITDMKKVQPHGPYSIGGHSFGGKVAFEMAQQLLDEGESIALLAIFESPAPGRGITSDALGWDDAKWYVEMGRILGKWAGVTLEVDEKAQRELSAEGQLDYFARQLMKAQILPPDAGEERLRGLINVNRVNSTISYVPSLKNPVPVALFKSEEPVPGYYFPGEYLEVLKEEAWGWDRYSEGPVRIFSVPGDHNTMLTMPHVKTLAARLLEALESRDRL
jgi:amino acid adenylation domain-containing protein/non-ribosomal peptide synthase protein (TIGR01720 family)